MLRDAAQRSGRPMERGDLGAVAAMFASAFRGGRVAPGLEAYLEAFCFGHPQLTPEIGSQVYENEAGELSAAILCVPLRFRVEGQPVTARLLCNFMAQGETGARGAACLSRHFRAKRHDFLFSDTASDASATHWKTGGGRILPIQSLEWCRVFRPLSACARRLHRSLRGEAGALLLAPLSLLDKVARRHRPLLVAQMPDGVSVQEVGAAQFLVETRPMFDRFSVCPDWDRSEFAWLSRMVEANPALGRLRFSLIRDAGGATIGAAAYCGAGQGRASVLNLLCLEGRERESAAALLADLDRQGYCEARGATQPFLMQALQAQRHMSFRHRGFFCIAGRMPALHRAVDQNLFYAEGLSSESWSRLLTDF